jgi:hypothetical protein
MSASDDPQAFFEEHAPTLQRAAAQGPDSAIAFIESFTDDIERRVLYLFARRALVMDEWEGRNLDCCVAVARAGIKEMLRQADNAANPAMRARCINLANAMSYDLAADTADCWPGDELPRTREHFQAGLAAAEDCIRWRTELDLGEDALATAWWAKGMHQLSLGDHAAARLSFQRSFELAQKSARDSGRPDGVGLDGDYGVILAWGYVGLADWALGEPDGKVRYGEAIATFNAQGADPELEEDARHGIDQLETVRAKYIGT